MKRFFDAHKALQAFVVSVSTTSAFLFGAYAFAQKVATDDEVQAAVWRHDHGNDQPPENPNIAHPELHNRIEAIATVVSQHGAITAAQQDEVQALWERMTRLAASERETDSRLKLMAADFYADEFKRLSVAGTPPSKAFLDALRQPWPHRPRLR